MKNIEIKRFKEFATVYENENDETRLVDFFASVSRNYETQRPFYTDLLQFIVEEERRDWRSTRKYVKLEKTVTHDAFYKLKFVMDDKHFILEIEFTYDFSGQKEKDAPEMNSGDENNDRLNVVLVSIKIEKIKIVSTGFDITRQSRELTPPVKKSCESFIVKMMEDDYDSLGAQIYKIEAE